MGRIAIEIGLRATARPDDDPIGGDIEGAGRVDAVDDEVHAGGDHRHPLATAGAGEPADRERDTRPGESAEPAGRSVGRHRRRRRRTELTELRQIGAAVTIDELDCLDAVAAGRSIGAPDRRADGRGDVGDGLVDRRRARQWHDARELEPRIPARPEAPGPARTADRGEPGLGAGRRGVPGCHRDVARHADEHAAKRWQRRSTVGLPIAEGLLAVPSTRQRSARILFDPHHRLVRFGHRRPLLDAHAPGEMPDIVGALRPARRLRGADGDRLGGINGRHLDARGLGDRRGEPARRKRRERAGGRFWLRRHLGACRPCLARGHQQHQRHPPPRAVTARRRTTTPRLAVPTGGRSNGGVIEQALAAEGSGRSARAKTARFIGAGSAGGQGVAPPSRRPQVPMFERFTDVATDRAPRP